MAQSIKFKDENYIDSSGVTHNRELLSEILNNKSNIVTVTAPAISSWGNTKSIVPFSEVRKIGNKLSANVNGTTITIGTGVNHVLINANFSLQCKSSVTSESTVTIYKNGTHILSGFYHAHLQQYEFSNAVISPIIVDVAQGDTLSFYIESNFTGQLHNSQYGRTYMTVQVID